MTAASQGQASSQREASWPGHRPGREGRGHGAEWQIGVVLEAFLDWPLERVLTWLAVRLAQAHARRQRQ